MEKEKQRKNVISMLRSCIVSTKGKLTLNQLNSDYKTLIGTNIPYKSLGFDTLEDLIASDLTFIVCRRNGETLVDATSEKSSHIIDMVNKQKGSKKPTKSHKSVSFNDWRSRPAQTTAWRPKFLDSKPSNGYASSTRPASVSHKQFVSAPKYVAPKGSYSSNKSSYDKSSYSAKSNFNDKQSYNKPAFVEKQSDKSNSANVNNVKSAPIKKPVDHFYQNEGFQNHISPVNAKNYAKGSNFEECSALLSTKKRIMQKMQSLNIDRDSGNSSPISDQAGSPPKQPAFEKIGDPMTDLRNFVEAYKLGPIEITSDTIKKQNLYLCKIKIDKYTFMSYPQEFRIASEAQNYCAEKALQKLLPLYTKRRSLLLSSDKDILERMSSMLQKHNNGLWAWQLELDYQDKYQEQLPGDWLKIVDSSPTVQVERCSNNYVIRHCEAGHALQKDDKWTTFMDITDVSIPANTVQFGDDGKLMAEITCVAAANEIWCQQCQTEERNQFNTLMVNMENYYNENHSKLSVSAVKEANYYAARFDNTWYRIRAIKTSDSTVQCFFIDYGDEIEVNISDIYKLQREFAVSQAQAFVCRLIGLEHLYDLSRNSQALYDAIMGKNVVLEIDEKYADEDSLSLPVYLYDFDTGVSINEQLLSLLCIETCKPILEKDSITEVFISNIESNGDIYVQIHSPGFELLNEKVLALQVQICEKKLTPVKSIAKNACENKLFLAKYKIDNNWYRAQLIDWSPKEDMAQIYFVDYGDTDVIQANSAELYELDDKYDDVGKFPFQAVRTRIAIDNIPKNFKELATKEMPDDMAVLLKISKYNDDNIPVVEFFKRNTDGGLFCINKSIEMVCKMQDQNNNENKLKMKLSQYNNTSKNVPSSGCLEFPELPKKNDFWEIRIPFAVSPWNFFVQPLSFNEKLNKLMHNLQEKYNSRQNSTPLRIEDIEPGKIYASKHDDGQWYRTSVIKVINSFSISVFYCDFGYYGNLTVTQLVLLDAEFTELPFQAVKAKLGGIKPKQNKWTMEDCEYFKTLVERKTFQSILKEIEKDELYKSDIVLTLELICTASEEDVYIHKDLIKKGIASELKN